MARFVKSKNVVITQAQGSQVIQNHVRDIFNYACVTVRANAVELACLTTNITTTQLNSQIEYDALVSLETTANKVFILTRTINGVETELGSAYSGMANQPYGITNLAYDTDSDSTMGQNKIQFIDSPNVASGITITYKLKMYGDDAGNININHTITDAAGTSYERATSNVRLTEIGGTPVNNYTMTDVTINSFFVMSTGTANNLVINPSGVTLYTGLEFRIMLNLTNTSSIVTVTHTPSGLTYPLKMPSASGLINVPVGALLAGNIITVIFDGTYYQAINGLPSVWE